MPKPPQPPKKVGGKLIDADGDEVITTASQLDGEEPEEDEAKSEEGDDEEVDDTEDSDEDEESSEEDESDEEEADSTDDGSAATESEEDTGTSAADASGTESEMTEEQVEINGKVYSRDQLSQIFSIGERVHEYTKDKPGFDPILLHKRFTEVTTELARLKRGESPKAVEAQVATSPATRVETKPKADLSKFKPEDIAVFQELAAGLGFVRAEDLEQREIQERAQNYEAVKQAEISKFLEAHPEYKPENDPGDLRWQAYLKEFQLFRLPEDPRQLGMLLERAHSAFAGTPSGDKKKLDLIIAKKLAGRPSQSSSASSGASGAKPKPAASPKGERLGNLAAKGGLKGFSPEELSDMFGAN